ncbi:carbohydrate ABC transporter permease [Microbacterium rhizosphaerae]|uniref:Carbohydrate ABC transporter permease n=1 Tax=Microbacterium rhizosphaerae TaxID=1678237 RepID=A0ABZ0SKH0_9MICO|nr:carbohydrate ABC transporter permease [Microbacterium rhizosphaerae]WPR89320.1 carbohydrate ABC transporter permease [Microbacterium rhizosphaerae]
MSITLARSSGRKRQSRRLWLVYTLLIAGAVLMIFPFIWEILTSFKTLSVAASVPPQVLPLPPTTRAYDKVLNTIPFWHLLGNSVLLTVIRTIGQVALCTMAGYGFARFTFPGKNILFIGFLAILMVPGQLFILPQYEIIQHLGMLNTIFGIALPGLFSVFGTFLLRQFFQSLPIDMEEAARLDGANEWQIFWHVMLPLAKPGIIALIVLTSLWSWNDFLWPLVVASDENSMPLSVGLTLLTDLRLKDDPLLMAGALLASLPMIVVFLVLQRQFIKGIAFSGVKG